MYSLPNPTKGQLNWDIDNVTSIDIYNNNGQLVLREKTEGNSLSIEQINYRNVYGCGSHSNWFILQ